MIRGRNASPLAQCCEFLPITSALVKLVLRSRGSDGAARPTLANRDSVFGHGRRTVEDFWRASFGPVLLFRAWLLRPTTSVHDCRGGHVWRCVAAATGTYCSYRRRATGGAPPTVGGLARTCDAAEAQALGALVASIGGQPPTRTFIACADGTEATCVWVSGGIVLCEADPRAGQGRSGAA